MRYVAAFLVVLAVALVIALLINANRTGDTSLVGRGGQEDADTAEDTADGAAGAPTSTPTEEALEATTPTPAPSPSPTPTPAEPASFTMVFTGDLLSHTPVIAQAGAYGSAELAYDYRPMFDRVTEQLAAADLAICVLETPLSSDNASLTGYPIFNAPYQLADAVATVGYDGCATASNHSYDQGPAGVASTLDQLDRAGVGHAGMARTADEGQTPTLYEVGEVTVAHLSWTYGLNGFLLPADQPYLVDVTEVSAILAEAGRARAAGADLVVLSIQWGNEYQSDPSPEQVALAEQLTASPDIDLVIGNHVHVVQPVAEVNGKWVVYGLGNFLSNQSPECCPANSQDGVIITTTVSGSEAAGFAVTDVTFTPTWVDRSNYTIISLPEALADPAIDPGLAALYQTSFDRTVEVINRLGAALEPTSG